MQKMAVKTVEWSPLPETDASVRLQLLNGGSFTANYSVLHAGVKEESFRMYNWAFYIFHSGTDRHILWDLGLTSVIPPRKFRNSSTDLAIAESGSLLSLGEQVPAPSSEAC